ncbi:MAG TPA: RNA-binding protein [Syntrophaceae bacterium]|jgi:cold-inducible RNA-binding protein|nr:RNA-binding protein [Syntrophaceae bacterium]
MNKNLYVGNLTANATEDVIRDNFTTAGTVAAVTIIKDNYTKQSKGFGFVEMETEEGARQAIEMFNGGKLDGNTIVVNEARPKKDRGGQRRDFGRRGGFRNGNGSGGHRY